MERSLAFIPGVSKLIPWVPLWVLVVALTIGFVVCIFILQDIAIRIIARHVKSRYPTFQRVFLRTRGIVRFGIIILAASIAIPVLPISNDGQKIAQNAVVAALVFMVGWIAVVAAGVAADGYLNRLNLSASDNLQARTSATQVRVLRRALNTVIMIVTVSLALMSFESVRQFGISLFASAGAAGIILGLAARPVLANLIAGVQIALTQPVRIDDAVVVEGEWGWIEELNATYVVVRLWDRRRLIVPLSYFLEKPFQNWTRSSASIIGTVLLRLDYTAPIENIRAKMKEIVAQSALWDRDVANLQVTDSETHTIEVRILVSASNSPAAWDLRCEVREKLLTYIQANIPSALPHRRNINETRQSSSEKALVPSA